MELGVIAELLKNMIKERKTVRFPHEKIDIPEKYRGEHKYDIDKCTGCGLCSKICPNKAIEMVSVPQEKRGDYPKTYPEIDLGKCCFCALCEDICPSGAIRLGKNFYLSTFDSESVIKTPLQLP